MDDIDEASTMPFRNTAPEQTCNAHILACSSRAFGRFKHPHADEHLRDSSGQRTPLRMTRGKEYGAWEKVPIFRQADLLQRIHKYPRPQLSQFFGGEFCSQFLGGVCCGCCFFFFNTWFKISPIGFCCWSELLLFTPGLLFGGGFCCCCWFCCCLPVIAPTIP